MKLELQRGRAFADAIPGELWVDGDYECVTLERVGVEISAGFYRVTIYLSPRFGRRVPLLHDVPSRNFVEIHVGNWPRDTRGCIIVGRLAAPGMVGGSSAALDELVKRIDGAISRGEDVWLEVKAAQAVTVSA